MGNPCRETKHTILATRCCDARALLQQTLLEIVSCAVFGDACKGRGHSKFAHGSVYRNDQQVLLEVLQEYFTSSGNGTELQVPGQVWLFLCWQSNSGGKGELSNT